MKLSHFQENIINEFKNSDKNIIIQAVPGSGKTTTLLELLKHVDTKKSAIFLAFNKSIVDELSKKITNKQIQVSTIHSLGCKSIFAEKHGKVKINNYKIFVLAKSIQEEFVYKRKKRLTMYINNLIDIVNFYRINNCKSYDEIDRLIDYYNIPVFGKESEDAKLLLDKYFSYNKKHLNSGLEIEIDFVDMIYMPINYDFELYKYDYIFIDECQDLNICQQLLINKLKHKKTRFVAVGDKYQCIFNFAGADMSSYDNLMNSENTIQLPLNYSYRCGQNIINKAKKLYDIIEDNPNIHEGEVIELYENFNDINIIKEGDFVLCRNTMPLIQLYFMLIQEKKKAYIYGSDMGKGVLQIYNIVKGKDVNTIKNNCEKLLSDLYQQLVEQGVKKPLLHNRYAKLQEQIDIIRFVLKRNKLENVEKVINELFSDNNKTGIRLMTMHKSKGLEADNVFILNDYLCPSKYAKTKEELISEKNLLYVAITRAKKKLYFIDFELKK